MLISNSNSKSKLKLPSILNSKSYLKRKQKSRLQGEIEMEIGLEMEIKLKIEVKNRKRRRQEENRRNKGKNTTELIFLYRSVFEWTAAQLIFLKFDVAFLIHTYQKIKVLPCQRRTVARIAFKMTQQTKSECKNEHPALNSNIFEILPKFDVTNLRIHKNSSQLSCFNYSF